MITTTVPDPPTDRPDRNSHKKQYGPTIARILMGLMFLVFGLNGFFHFIPQPKSGMPAEAMQFFGAMMKTGYFIPMIFTTQTIVGILLLSNRFVPLALALIAPVIVNILLYHTFLAPASIGPGIVVTALELYLAWSYRQAFEPMLAAKISALNSA